MVLLAHLVQMVLLDSEEVQVNLVRTVPKESRGHAANVVKLVLPEYQELREKTAKMAHLENLVPMDFQELQGKEVPKDSEDLLDQVAPRVKRVLLENVVVQAPLGLEEWLENLAEMAPLEVQELGVYPEAQVDQATMENQVPPEVKEKVVVQVPLARLVPEASLVSWASLVLKEMMVLLARMENAAVLEALGSRALLGRTVKLDPKAPQDPLGHLVTKEMQVSLVHKDYKACLVPVVLQEKMENLVKQVQRVM